jgi:hypothetical protein
MLLGYWQEITETTSRSIKSRYIAGIRTFTGDDPVLAQDDLLVPPRIDFISLEIYEGHVDDLIMLDTSTDFGIGQIRLTIRDEQGNLLESGDAAPWPDDPRFWDYLTKVPVPASTTVIVTATAMDVLGGVGRLSKRVTLNQDIGDVLRGEDL